MVDMNYVILCGRLVRDPERKSTQSGTVISTFTLATKTSQRDEDGGYKSAFNNCVAYGKTAEIISNYCFKGSELGITGELRDNKYTDKNGNPRTIKEIFVGTVKLGSKAVEGDEGISYSPTPKTQPETEAEASQVPLVDAKDLFGDELEEYKPLSDDELPF